MDQGTLQDLAHFASQALEAASFAVILGAVGVSTVLFLLQLRREPFETNYRAYRANLGRGILLGLELLIAGDIIKSVVLDPTLQSMLVLGGIVIIRTFLSLSLDVEINGHWPWETTRLTQQQVPGDKALEPAAE
jgi:uncharacterized membrane protein